MTLGQLLVLYLLAGAGVAVAVAAATTARGRGEFWFQVVASVVFWPLFLPLLLGRTARAENKAAPQPVADELGQTIARVDAELAEALRSLDGWAEGVLAREKDRLHELRGAWTAQAERIREMDRLLAHVTETPDTPAVATERLRNSQEAVRRNIERLQQTRQRSEQNLLETLAWVRELVSMIHLAKFTGAPAARAEELVAQIAAAVEGLSALTWQDEASEPGPEVKPTIRGRFSA